MSRLRLSTASLPRIVAESSHRRRFPSRSASPACPATLSRFGSVLPEVAFFLRRIFSSRSCLVPKSPSFPTSLCRDLPPHGGFPADLSSLPSDLTLSPSDLPSSGDFSVFRRPSSACLSSACLSSACLSSACLSSCGGGQVPIDLVSSSSSSEDSELDQSFHKPCSRARFVLIHLIRFAEIIQLGHLVLGPISLVSGQPKNHKEIEDSNPIDYAASSSSRNGWWSDLVVGLQAAKRLLFSVTRFQARDSSDGAAKPKRISFQFQSVTWKLEKALSNIPYDLYDISEEVRELMELARLQLRRAMQRYGSLNSMTFSSTLSEPMERDAFSNIKTKVEEEKLESISETLHFAEEEKQDSPPMLRKISSVSLAYYLSKDADTDRLDKLVTKNTDESKTPDKLTFPVDFLCPVSLELMKDPVIVATGQTYERAYIQRWIDCGNVTCPKTQQRLKDFTLTPNYVLRSLISRWCTEHNVEQPAGYINGRKKNGGDMSVIRALVHRLSSRSIEDRRNAVSEIRSLSKRSTDNRILIAEAGAIPVLVNLLSSEDVAMQENAITCVLNLSIYDNNKELIMFAGAIPSIVQVLRAGTMEARGNAAATLFSLSLADENKIIIGGSGAIPALVDLLENGTPRGKKDAATALFNLCICQGNKGRAVRAGIVTALVKMMSDSSRHRMVDEALTILSVLATNQDAKSAIVKANALPALIGILQKDQARNQESAAAILLSLCKRDTERLISIGRLGVVVPLMNLSKNGTERGKREAISLLELLREACQ